MLWKIDLTLVSFSAMSRKCSSGYVKDNDVRYGLKVAHRDPKSSKVIGLQCHFCIAFGREEKVGSKRKAATTVQGWSHPFRYDNIENHLCNQHSGQWHLYQALESSSERASFFNDVPRTTQEVSNSLQIDSANSSNKVVDFVTKTRT